MTCSKENEATSTDILKNVNNSEIVLSDVEKQIRQGWLWSLWAAILVTLMSYAVIYYIGFKSAGEVLLYIMDSGIALFLLFFLAYKKFGTKWIACYLLLSPISAVWESSKTFGIDIPAATMLETIWIWTTSVTSVSVYIYFWVQSLRLYILNRNIKKRKKQIESGALEAASVV